jgi:hypothetical protein
MRLIPTHCDTCSRTELIAGEAIVNGHASCSACGGRARTLPGESYAAEDAALFEELRAALEQAAISPTNAAILAVELEARNNSQAGRGLKRLAQLIPALGVLELVVPGKPATIRKAEGMLATLLDGLSSRRTRSGTMAAVTDDIANQLVQSARDTGSKTSSR